ncbi:acyl-[ACP]--phospholipid O-acyltransferase [Cohaesibacter celericrescens]|uniref:Acyl-[ACP]--phospholipid O-acyltransferase n=1 Tax=Cohaesibacter celericrescens TaxID=2067669 RepID=A0A2N5XMP1_9HYPH|nr:acyl-[ACP]--phospholipid O-acyltransferase [Cohaesibacter celericrescens]PLW75744.1 acyl-[ACP]--phospholipid O-acyltransferase [Cohaesibacter celericrescens]
MRLHLMRSKRFAPLFWTQFLSAFNDNFLRYSLIFLILFKLSADQAASLVMLAGAIFMLPFLLLSALGGEMADKYDKGRLAEKLKLAEIGASFVAVLGISMGSIWLSMLALFLFGVVSALFGPIKFGILPDHLEQRELPAANAWVEGATFVAILAGTIVAGLVASGGIDAFTFGPMMVLFAVACWGISRAIPDSGSGDPDLVINRNIFASTMQLLSELRRDKRMWRASLIVSWFWLLGAVLTALVPSFVTQIMGGSPLVVTVYSTVFAVSVAIGSAIAAWLCAGRVVLLPAPFGAALAAFFSLQLAWNLSGMDSPIVAQSVAEFFSYTVSIRVGLDLAGLAIAGALLVVPAFTAIQTWADKERRARVIAAVNVMNAVFIFVSGAFLALLQSQGASIPQILMLLAVCNGLAAWLMIRYLPTNPIWDLVNILFRAFSRLEVEGRENLEKAGKAPILAFNHVSFLDGPLALAITEEEPVFAIDAKTAKAWWMHPFLRFCNYLVLEPSLPIAQQNLIQTIQNGNSLVIFPEGRVTDTGSLMKVYDVAAMAADMTGSMVVPIRIDGLERSYSTSIDAKNVRRQLFPKVKVTILEPVRLAVPQELKGRKRRMAAGAQLQSIMAELVFRTTNVDQTVLQKVIKVGRSLGLRRNAIEDPFSGRMTYGDILTGSRVLGARFLKDYASEDRVGVMLPNANGTVVVILGLMSAGKVPAMLNFTSGVANLVSACKTANLSTVLTSRSFVEQAKLEAVIEALKDQVKIVWVDDIRATISLTEKLKGRWYRTRPLTDRQADDPAVVLFTSGSEGVPKGVVLTHRNLLSNAAQCGASIDFNLGDRVFNVLPVFHCFGLTACTILPLVRGLPIYFYPSPLHYRIIPELVYGTNATILFGTDTFLNGYARTAHPFDFRSVRYCVAGAEPVKASTRKVFLEQFGVRILEGYGVTEASPVIALNTPMYNKAGSVGKPLPGIETRLEPVPGIAEGGRLFVKGANIMAGYLRAENPDVLEPPVDGWHDTGDIVTIDAEGYITIIGRAKRFADIAGEKISLAAIDRLADDLWPGYLSATGSLPDPKRGERVIMVTDNPDANRSDLTAYARSMGVSDLMVPSEIVIQPVPVLGTGKIDFVGVQKSIDAMSEQHKQ